jgi:hypothetical protein
MRPTAPAQHHEGGEQNDDDDQADEHGQLSWMKAQLAGPLAAGQGLWLP